jgi:hypothetical protein
VAGSRPVGRPLGRPRAGSRRPRCRLWLISPEGFRELRHSCLLSQRQAAAYLGVCLRTVRHWDSGRNRVPWSVVRLLRLLRAGELGGLCDEWQGWTINRLGLHAPDGRTFRERDMRLWWMTSEHAALFRARFELPGVQVSAQGNRAGVQHLFGGVASRQAFPTGWGRRPERGSASLRPAAQSGQGEASSPAAPAQAVGQAAPLSTPNPLLEAPGAALCPSCVDAVPRTGAAAGTDLAGAAATDEAGRNGGTFAGWTGSLGACRGAGMAWMPSGAIARTCAGSQAGLDSAVQGCQSSTTGPAATTNSRAQDDTRTRALAGRESPQKTPCFQGVTEEPVRALLSLTIPLCPEPAEAICTSDPAAGVAVPPDPTDESPPLGALPCACTDV